MASTAKRRKDLDWLILNAAGLRRSEWHQSIGPLADSAGARYNGAWVCVFTDRAMQSILHFCSCREAVAGK